jgi:hypothetical protein
LLETRVRATCRSMVGVGGGDSLRIAWKEGKGTPPH